MEVGIGTNAISVMSVGSVDLQEDGPDASTLLWRHWLLSAGEANVHKSRR
jgi:hypothetical protein